MAKAKEPADKPAPPADDKPPKAKSDRVLFRFNHRCNIEGAEGSPGEVNEIPRDVAELLEARGGGRIE